MHGRETLKKQVMEKNLYVERHKEYKTKRGQSAVPELQELFRIRVM